MFSASFPLPCEPRGHVVGRQFAVVNGKAGDRSVMVGQEIEGVGPQSGRALAFGKRYSTISVSLANGRLRELHEGGQPPDHAPLWGVPETRYLKCLVLEAD